MQRVWSVATAAGDRSRSGIDVEKLISAAQCVSGNFDGIETGLYRRVERFVGWINAHTPVSEDRLERIEGQVRRLLVNRLRLAKDRRRLPGIAREHIKRPIFVIGFARTGTTLIHSLLAADPDARTPLHWHTFSPSPPPGELAVSDFRIEEAGQDVDRMLRVIPGLLSLHPYWDRRALCPIEDEQIFSLDFNDPYPSLSYEIPLMPDAGNDGSAYRFHREFLQHLQWNRQPKHWVVKGVFHQFALDALFETYPDALCIWPHRDPAQVCPSLMALLAVIYGGVSNWAIDFKTMGPGFVETVSQALRVSLANPLIDDPRIVHVDFHQLTKDPIGIIRKAYAHWGMAVSAAFEERMQAWLADPANRSDRYGRYDYALEPFGLDAAELREAFGFYRERFGLDAQPEV